MLVDYVIRQVVGVLAALEVAMRDSDQKGNLFWFKILQRQQQRVKGLYDQHIVSDTFSSKILLGVLRLCLGRANQGYRTDET